MSAESDEWGCRVRGRTSCPLPVDSGQHRATVPAVERLTKASSEEIANIVTLFLGLAIGSTMVGAEFLKPSTLAILILGIVAFALDASAGILFGKPRERRPFQSADWRGGHQRVPDGRARRAQGRAGRGL
jgi:hypothetical protein